MDVLYAWQSSSRLGLKCEDLTVSDRAEHHGILRENLRRLLLDALHGLLGGGPLDVREALLLLEIVIIDFRIIAGEALSRSLACSLLGRGSLARSSLGWCSLGGSFDSSGILNARDVLLLAKLLNVLAKKNRKIRNLDFNG